MRSQRLIPKLLPVIFLGLALAVAWLYQQPQGSTATLDLPGSPGSSAGRVAAGTTRDADALDDPRSGEMVEVAGTVSRILEDDSDGSRHQRFILALDDGTTVLVAHNIDLAPRVPIEAGDRARIRGQYERNERGGVVHWTHHDPAGSRSDTGWIEHHGRVYE